MIEALQFKTEIITLEKVKNQVLKFDKNTMNIDNFTIIFRKFKCITHHTNISKRQ